MRPGQGVHVQGTLGVGDFTASRRLDVGEKDGRASKDGYGPFRIDRLRRQPRGKEARKDEQTSSLDRISPRLASERDHAVHADSASLAPLSHDEKGEGG
jgi:hypothetical protein